MENKKHGEAGTASLLGICMMLLVLLLGLGSWQMVRSGAANSDECLVEMRLRLSAESSMEKVSARLETGDLSAEQLKSTKIIDEYDFDTQPFTIVVKTSLKKTEDDGALVLESQADVPESMTGGWIRRKIIYGWLQKRASSGEEGEKYVWRGWRPESLSKSS